MKFLAPLTANYLLGVHGRTAIRLAALVSNSVTGRSVQSIYLVFDVSRDCTVRGFSACWQE